MRAVRENHARTRALLVLSVALAVPLPFAVACSEEGETPVCTEQVLYDFTDPNYGLVGAAGQVAELEAKIQKARKAAEAENCLTPIGTATSSPGNSSGGSSGSGGRSFGGSSGSGTGGSGGSTGGSGGSTGGNAGAGGD